MSDDEKEDRYLQFLDRFGGNIWNFCLSTSDSCADADDLMQEIFAAVWEGLPSVDTNPRRENRWLRRVMVSVLSRHLQHRIRRIFMNLSDLPDLTAADSDTELLDALAEHLPPDDRTLMQSLREGYKVNEIAERMGISVPAVHTRISRLKKKLKTIYDKHYGE